MTLENLNQLGADAAKAELFKCCGSARWSDELTALRPFASKEILLRQSDRIWASLTESDSLEAFSHHPKIGDLKSLEKKFASTKEWAGKEQSGVDPADQQTLLALAEGNQAYEKKFGYIFIVCASGKTAAEMLELLNKRMHNDPALELQNARAEQNKITHLRLEKLLA